MLAELRKFFKPELLNRFDEVVIFESLSQNNMTEVASLGISATRKLLKQQGFDLDVTKEALERLAKEGYDPIYGARPLRRLIKAQLKNQLQFALSTKLLLRETKF